MSAQARLVTAAAVAAGVIMASPALAVSHHRALRSSAESAANSPSKQPSSLTQPTERGFFVFVPADPVVVRSVGRIPTRWKLALDQKGKARVFLGMQSADVTIGGRTRPVVYSEVFALLDSTALPPVAAAHGTSDYEGSPQDLYVISWSISDKDFTTWVRTGTGVADRAHYVPGLGFDLAPGALHDFAFTEPRPSTSPFAFTATATDALVPVSPSRTDYWLETSRGTAMFETSGPNDHLGFLQQWKLTADPTSPLSRLTGGPQHDFACSPTAAPAPLVGILTHKNQTGCIGDEESAGGTWRKQFFPSTR